MIRRPPRSTLFPHDALPIFEHALTQPPFVPPAVVDLSTGTAAEDRKSTRLNSSHVEISYAVFCLKKKNTQNIRLHQHTHRCHCNELTNKLTSRTMTSNLCSL